MKNQLNGTVCLTNKKEEKGEKNNKYGIKNVLGGCV